MLLNSIQLLKNSKCNKQEFLVEAKDIISAKSISGILQRH